MFGLLPPGVGEILLLVSVVCIGFLLVRIVRKRHAYAPVSPEEATALPMLTTEQRVTGTVRRVFRDPAQGVWLVDLALGKRKFTFCATDYAQAAEKYQALVGKQADFALYGFATLAPGGAEAMRDQIKDSDKVEITPDLVRLIPAGQFPNDYVVIGRVLSHRQETLDGDPLIVYRTQVVRSTELTLVIELATEPTATPYPDQSMVHGSARLCGYLA